ncbi:YnbE family lipoprotein [Altererythrobacter aerius]|uniref:YnbE family lipoprotein n=1 Tax=Tsuneonella aeria TaxID=1837929 RepID=A0A6I4T9M3_9SPHN|nr:YnbE family lipoprotein [Tsuneonella aeria]MXO73892.1 YnbE family lipoprotein [Tsuneonella aeria]
MTRSDMTDRPGAPVAASARRRRGVAVVAKGLAGAVMALGGAAGCVNVTAPDKPIVIELNVNIRQEVIYRLAADAGETIEENEDIF